MKIAVRYQSRGGNTRAVAEIIAESLGVKAEPIDKPLDEAVDVLFLGGGVYMGDADARLKEYLQKLDSRQAGQIVAFSTTGSMKTTLERIAEYAQKAEIEVNDKQLCLKMLLRGNTILGLKGGNLSGAQIEKVKIFTSEVLEDLQREA